MKKALAIFLVILFFLMCGCHGEEAAATQPVQTEMPTEPPTESVTEPPTEPKPDWLHSGIRSDGTLDEGALFIGDSLTNGLLAGYLTANDLLGDCRYMATPGASLLAFFDGPRLRTNGQYYSYFSETFEGMLMCEAAAAAGESVKAIYLMMGTNHNDYVTVQLYIDVLDYLLEVCPNATLYLQQVPCAQSSYVDHESVNRRIAQAYDHFAQQQELRVHFIQTQDAIGMNLKQDGVHLTEEGYRLWYEALLAYAEENDIPQ